MSEVGDRKHPACGSTAAGLAAILRCIGEGRTRRYDLEQAFERATGKTCGERKIYRYLQALRAAGFDITSGPLYTLRDHPLGIALGKRQGALLLKIAESSSDILPLGVKADDLSQKLRNSLPKEVVEYSEQISLTLEQVGVAENEVGTDIVDSASRAVMEAREIRFEYEKTGKRSERRARPLHLFYKNGVYRLMAEEFGKGKEPKVKEFRLDRITALEVGERFEHRMVAPSLQEVYVAIAPIVYERGGHHAFTASLAQVMAVGEAGSAPRYYLLKLLVESTFWLHRELARKLGFARLVSPPEIAASYEREVKQMLEVQRDSMAFPGL